MRRFSRSTCVAMTSLLVLLLPAAGPVRASNPDPAAQWFPDAGLGLFVHWGLASVKGVNISWSMRAGHVLTSTPAISCGRSWTPAAARGSRSAVDRFKAPIDLSASNS
jgi:hypothetical protein